MFTPFINSKPKPFQATAFHQGDFIDLTEKDVLGRWAIFMFYPADFTFVCPTELGGLAEHYQQFKDLDVEVYSISTDTHFSHKAWHDASPTLYSIRFPMIADPTGMLTRHFGVMVEEEGIALRGTFLINPEGEIKIAEVYDLGIGRSAAELLRKTQAA